MIAKELISSHYLEIAPNDSLDTLMKLCVEFHVEHLPVIDDDEFIGIASAEWCSNHPLRDEISKFKFQLQRISVKESAHFLDVLKTFAKTGFSILPVLGNSGQYLGAVTYHEIVNALSEHASINENGAIIELKMSPKDYSLSKIAQIVEGHDGKILTSYISPQADEELEVTLKLNTIDIGGMLQSFSRFGYRVSNTFNYEADNKILEERYEALMKFLNI